MLSKKLLRKRAVKRVELAPDITLPMVFSPSVMDEYLRAETMNAAQFQDLLNTDPFKAKDLFWYAFSTGCEFGDEDNPFKSKEEFLELLTYEDVNKLMMAYADSMPKAPEGSEDSEEGNEANQ